MNEYVKDYSYARSGEVDMATAYSSLMRKVYVWMSLALVLTGLTSYYVASSPSMMYTIFSNQVLFYGLIIAELVVVLGMTACINKMSFAVASGLFALYSVLNGVTLSAIFIAYTLESIASTFFITAGTFGAMAVYGSVTNTDLTKMGKILIMALVGIIIASIVNIFLGNSMLQLGISILGVVIFTGLTAYDAQKIKDMMIEYGGEVNDATQKLAVIGALTLYLDFVNLFIYLLRLFGKRK